jgi:hypothetical protein
LGTSAEEVSIPGGANIAGNLALNSADATFPTSLDGGIYLLDGTSATADPGGGAAIWSASGNLAYRSSTTDEGAGGTKRLHNRAAESVSAGTYNLSTTYAQMTFSSTTPILSLPTAGTYLLSYFVQVVESGTVANDTLNFKLYDSTAAADVTASEATISYLPISKQGIISMSVLYTVSASATIQLWGQNANVTRGTAQAGSKLSFVRLY